MHDDFLKALSQAGIPPTHSLVFDGKLRRYNVSGDKKGRRNGWYRLICVRPDFSWGVFGCNKRGISGKYNSTEPSKLTSYDKTLIRRQQAQIKKEEEELQTKVAIKAVKIWNRLKIPKNNYYATVKRVGLYNVREMNETLVVPVYDDNSLVSLQFITNSGDKRFLTGGKIKGCYSIFDKNVTQKIFICEGYSTGASVFETTECMVVLAFFANNLVPVAEQIRTKYPQAEIIIAADNDQYTAGNPGISYARQAAEKIGAKVVYPDFVADNKNKLTDWNDFVNKFGSTAAKNSLMGIKNPVNVVKISDENLWKQQLITGNEFKAGYPLFDPKSKTNAYLFMLNHEEFRNLLVYNDFTGKIIFRKCPPWEDKEKFYPREIKDYDAPMWVNRLERLGIKISKDIVQDFMSHIANQTVINPPKDYFESLRWDGVNRLNTWLTYYLGAEKQDPEYLKLVGSKWIMGIVARAFEPGIKFDNALVLEGRQGIKKTAAFETLATFNGENFFLEFSGDFTTKDSLALMQGKIIVELSELASIRKSEVEEMKAFISRRIDEYRPPYGRASITRPRYFVLGGSTNKVGQEYLEDETGARRIWPVECGEAIDLYGLQRDQSQLYAEAVVRYKAKERIWLEGDEIALANGEQSTRQAQDAWQEKIYTYLQGQFITYPTITEVGLGIGLQTKDLNNYNIGRLKRCLKNLEWEEFCPEENNGRLKRWRKI